MLHSKNLVTKGEDRPVFNMWFGDFFEPYYTGVEKTKEAMKDIAEMGFNAVSLDSKLSDDFVRFYNGGEPSQYVKMQRLVADLCEENGLGLTYLALFNCGDNLYPKIRDEAPTFVDQVVGPNGELVQGYRHWSHEQMLAKADHCMNLYKYIGYNCPAVATDETGKTRKPFYFYHSPCFFQSFDKDGEDRYVNYLKSSYQDISALNEEYSTNYRNFDEIKLTDVWVVNLKESNIPNDVVAFKKYRDNQLYKMQVMDLAMKELTEELRKRDPEFYLYGCMTQWKYLLCNQIFITRRGLNLWNVGKYLDCPTYYTMPSDAYGDPNAYVVPAEMAILRSASKTEDLNGGLFVGRYLSCDLYDIYSIGEVIASSYGAGCTDLLFYGYSGLDDGGNFGKWSKKKKVATKRALDWFSDIRKVTGKRLKEKKAGILFPDAAYTLVDSSIFPEKDRRYANDFVGWYKQLSDCGINADILNSEQAIAQIKEYEMIILPSDPYYNMMKNKELENAIYKAVENGTTVFASGDSGKHNIFGMTTENHEDDSIKWEEEITDFSNNFYSFENAEELAHYMSDNKIAIAKKQIGKGEVYSFGFDYGACYCEKEQRKVPPKYGRNAQYPLTVLDVKPFERFTGLKIDDGIEKVEFENGTLYVNHTSYAIQLPKDKQYIHLEENIESNILVAHSATFVLK